MPAVDRTFWEERWNLGQIGFHEGAPNDLLRRHVGALGAGRVYVPLCGKTRDLHYLRDQGFEVTGVELVSSAIAQLFAELGPEAPVVDALPPFRRHRAGGLTVLEGDAFALTPAHLGGEVDAVFDRAALVAVDPSTREAYVARLAAALRPGGRVLLVTFDYDQAKLPGPPWAVSPEVVRALCEGAFEVELLEERRAAVSPKFAAAGAEVWERLFLLQKRA